LKNHLHNSPTFLVTGATGFIGASLIDALVKAYGTGSVTALTHTCGRASEQQKLERFRQQGLQVVECDLLKLPELHLPRPPFDLLYHLAGFTESENPDGPFEVNSAGTRCLIEWLGSALQGKRVIYSGTLASVDATNPPNAVTETTMCTPKTVYGKSKLEGENFIKLYADKLNYSYTILRLCTIVGPGYRPGGMFNIFPQRLARRALATRLNWPGRSSYLSLDDLVKILVSVLGYQQTVNETFVLDSGEGPSFDEVLEMIATVLSLPRKSIRLPAWCWRMLGAMASTIASSKMVSYRLHNTCWRVSHMIGNGLWADSSKITRLMGMKYESLPDALRKAYGIQN
jgi:dihydroflavonol-4-reductase